MVRLRIALETIKTALEEPNSLSEMIAHLEGGLGRALQPFRITICIDGAAAARTSKQIPLRLDGKIIGALLVESPPDEPALEVAVEVEAALRLLAAPIAAALTYRGQPEHRAPESRPANPEGRPANIDALCGIPNRRGFDEHSARAWERARQTSAPLVVALTDVDFFKTYNDRYGHVTGDRCLQQVGSLLMRRRDSDDGFAARYGGEEFVLVFEGTTLDRAVAEVQGIFDRLATLHIEHAGTTLGRVSMSAGLATVIPTPQQTMVGLVGEADRALYQAKRLGRNRICAGSFVSKAPVVVKLRGRQLTYAAADVPSFGREDDLARILSALRHARMLTLVGPRGIGKSRLLTLVADEATSRLHRPVIFVESELLRSGMDPATALASACDLSLGAGGVLEAVTDFLADREAIVILDDVGHSKAEIRSLCTHLCADGSGVSIVAAANAPLGIAVERMIVVAPLGDEAALQLLSFCAAGVGSAGRAIIRHLGGNPASIEAAADLITRLGVDVVMNRLATLGGVYTDPADLAALFSSAPEAA
jgi:diguanylate cyclase (GGDEF)-like protein